MMTKKVKKRGGKAEKRLVAKPNESFFRIFAVADDPDDLDYEDDRPVRGSGAEDGLLPLVELQGEMVLRLREDAVPRAAVHYIGALSGHDFEDGEDFDVDDMGMDWETGAPPPPGRR